jgi:8-oxo-dGTP diphosphatase
MTTFQPVDVVCALIIEKDRLLIVRYGPDSKHPGKWEFPGGKVLEGESLEEALRREISEELEIEIAIKEKLEFAEYAYPDRSIRLIPFLCTIKSGKLKLNEHEAYKWILHDELGNLDLLPADRLLLKTGENLRKLTDFLTLQGR